MGDDVLPVARDPAVARDVAHQRRGRLDLGRGERVLRREPRVLDPDGEVVALHAVQPAVVPPVQGAVVQRRDVPGPIPFEHELRSLAAVLVDDVVRARLGGGIHEPAPAARVIALAGVDDHDVHRARRVGRPLVEVGRRPPNGGCIVGRAAGIWRRRAGGRSRRGPGGSGPGACERRCPIDRAPVRRPAFGELDLGIPDDHTGPLLTAGTVDRRFASVRVEQRCRSTDVRDRVAARGRDRHTCERRAPLEGATAQCHHSEGGRPTREFLRSLDHLPPRLHPADPLEHRGRHVELGARRGERGAETGCARYERRPIGGEPRRRAGLDRRGAAGGDERNPQQRGSGFDPGASPRGQPRSALLVARLTPGRSPGVTSETRLELVPAAPHRPCLTSSTSRAGPASSDTR